MSVRPPLLLAMVYEAAWCVVVFLLVTSAGFGIFGRVALATLLGKLAAITGIAALGLVLITCILCGED